MTCLEKKENTPQEFFESLILRTRTRLYQRAYQALRNSADAEDITQEAIVRAWTRLDTFRASAYREVEDVMGAWLNRIALNELRNLIRHRRRIKTLSLDAPLADNGHGSFLLPELTDRSQDPAAQIERREFFERVHQAMERLSPDHHSCLLLLRQQRTYQEIGMLMKCSIGTVRSRVHRARVCLRQALQAE